METQIDISKIGTIKNPSTTSDPLTESALIDFSKSPEYTNEKVRQEKAKSAKLEEEVECLKDDRKARKVYGYAIFIFVGLYIAAVLVIFSCHVKMGISDKSAMALLYSSNINVIGLLAAVVRYLFPRRDGK